MMITWELRRSRLMSWVLKSENDQSNCWVAGFGEVGGESWRCLWLASEAQGERHRRDDWDMKDGEILFQEELLEKACRIIVVVLDIYSLNQSSSLTTSVSLIRRRPYERLFTKQTEGGSFGRCSSTIYLEPIPPILLLERCQLHLFPTPRARLVSHNTHLPIRRMKSTGQEIVGSWAWNAPSLKCFPATCLRDNHRSAMGNTSSSTRESRTAGSRMRAGAANNGTPNNGTTENSMYNVRSGRGSRQNLSFLHLGSSSRGDQARTEEPRRETKQEREVRKRDKERLARENERERSMKEEGVDGGYLVTLGTYVGPEDFNKTVVRQLMVCHPISTL
jgi:hypothetical protein